MREEALNWLNKQEKGKMIAYNRALDKPNVSQTELSNIESAIEVIAWLKGVVEKWEG